MRHASGAVALLVRHSGCRAPALKTGDAIRISTPTGSALAVAALCHGVRMGVLAVEHGFGHRQLGHGRIKSASLSSRMFRESMLALL